MEEAVFNYIKEHMSVIIIVSLLIGGFWLLSSKSQNSSEAAVEHSRTPDPVANMQSPLSKGNKSATVSLIQYSDFLCPSCSYFSTQIMPTIEKKYIDTGKIKFEFRPMAFIAPGSTTADEGANCAVEQGKFWQYHDATYNYVWNSAFSKGVDPKTTTILTADIVKQIATATGINAANFNTCLESGRYRHRVADSTNAANAVGVTSTPTILVNGKKLNGNISLQATEALIESQL